MVNYFLPEDTDKYDHPIFASKVMVTFVGLRLRGQFFSPSQDESSVMRVRLEGHNVARVIFQENQVPHGHTQESYQQCVIKAKIMGLSTPGGQSSSLEHYISI